MVSLLILNAVNYPVPSSGRTPIPGTVFSSSENISSSQSPQSSALQSDVKVVEPSSSPLEPNDRHEEEIIDQLTNQLKLSQVGEDDGDDDEKLWNTFNDVISQVS